MQADLFNLSISDSFERQAFQRSFFERKFTLRMDQLFGMGLVCIVFFVLVFAWGVERGKADSRHEFLLKAQPSHSQSSEIKAVVAPSAVQNDSSLTLPQNSVAIEVATDERSAHVVSAKKAPELKTEVVQPATAGTKYTIAHVTYAKKDQALNEIRRIKSKGYSSFLVSSGKYYQICVSGFDSRKNANDAIRSLRLKGVVSTDSYIRNMPAVH